MTAEQKLKNLSKEHIIIASEVEDRYARGWHVIGSQHDFSTKPKMIECFGTRIAVWRGAEDNTVHAINAYCPHMGADLSKGCVHGNDIVCPFHAWSWNGDGECTDIPYANKIPDKAKIRGWEVLEKNGLVFVWHDHERKPSIAEQEPRRNDDWHSEEWTDWTMTTIRIDSNCRELVDNMADMGHFGPVHYSKVAKFSNLLDGHTFTQFMEGGHEILTEGDTPMTSVATYEGPAYMTTTMTGSMDGEDTKVHLLVSHTPVTLDSFDIRFGVMMRKDPRLSEEENQQRVEENTQMNIDSFIQDVEIWNNKVRVDNPVLCDGDGPINLVRKWYSQFYMDVADIPAQLQKRKEHVTLG